MESKAGKAVLRIAGLEARDFPQFPKFTSKGSRICMADPVAQIALTKIVETEKSDTSRLHPVSRHDHYATALETCGAALKQRHLSPPDSFFLLLPPAFRKNYLV